MHRDVEEGSPLGDLFSRNALGLAGNTLLRFKGGEYEFKASGGSKICPVRVPWARSASN